MLSQVLCLLKELQSVDVRVSLQLQEMVEKILVDLVSVLAPNGRLKQLVQVHCVKKLFQLAVEDLHLVLEIAGEGVVGPDAIDDVLAGLQVAGVGASVQLVLQLVLYFVLQVFRDVVAVRNISDTSQGHCLHELVCKRWQVGLDRPHNHAVSLRAQLIIKLFVEAIGDSGVVVRPKVTLFAAMDVP